MNKYEIITSKGTLDTYGNDNISLNFSIKDILDITTRTNGYSKTITLPGTPTNNDFFAYIYDVNINNISFNPLKRIGVYVNVGAQQVIKGYMQLLNVQNDNGEISYEVTIFGTLKNLITSFGDNVMNSLDLSEFNHFRSQDTVKKSWDYNVYQNGTLKSFGQGGDGYVYPYIINGNSQDIKDFVYLYDFNPSIYSRTLMYKLAQWAGYTITSNFLDSDYYRKIIIPYVGDKIQMSEESKNERKVTIGVTSTDTWWYDVTPFLKNGSDWYYSSFNGSKIELFRDSGTVDDDGSELVFRDDLNQWDSATSTLTVAKTGRYDIDFIGNAFMYVKNTHEDHIEFLSGEFEYSYEMALIRKNGKSATLDTSVSTAYPDGNIKFQLNSNVYEEYKHIYDDQVINIDMAKKNVLLEAGDKIQIRIGLLHPKSVNWRGINDKSISVQFIWKSSYDGSFTKLSVAPSVDESYGQDSIEMTKILSSTQKMKDFFLDQCKMFNLVVMENPNKENDLIIEPEEDFYQTKQRVVDMDQSLDYNSNIKITPMSEVNAKTYKFTYAEDDDFYNKGYKDETKRLFGDFEMQIDNDFSDAIKKIELGFASTPCGNLNITEGNRYAPFLIDDDIKEGLKSKKVKPRILFYNGLVPLTDGKILKFKDYPAQPFLGTSVTSMTSYPAASMWDDVFNPTYSLEFGRLSKVYFENSGVSPNQNLFEKFYKSTMLNIIDTNASLFEGKFVLTTKMMAEFDFRDIWFIQGQYWRVNEIKDYNPIEGNQLTSVVLYKIIDLDILSKFQVVIPVSNNSCPTDVALKKTSYKESVYFSQSGQAIGAQCCKQLGGNFVNGMCKVSTYVIPKPWPKPTPWHEPIEFEPAGAPWDGGFNPTWGWDNGPSWMTPITSVNGGWNTVPTEEPYGPLSRNDWNNSHTNTNVWSYGSQNHSNDNVYNAFIVGDNNSVIGGIENAVVFGSGIIANESNTMYMNNTKLGPDGILRHTGVYIIDGGENEVFNINKTNPIEIIDGTFNSVRNVGGDSWARFIIDGNGDAGGQF
jgi:hypothetical protein